MAKKLSWATKNLIDSYKESAKKNPLDSDNYNCLSKLTKANDIIVDNVLISWGKFFDKNEFHETTYAEDPDYYARIREWRGNKIKSDNLCNDINSLFWEAWDMLSFYSDLDQKRFIQTITDHIEYGSAPKDLNIKSNPKDCDLESLTWGDESIMDSAEWDRLEEYMSDNNICYNEQSDLIWREVNYFDIASIINVFEEIDEELEWWNGEEGLLDLIEEMYNHDQYQLQTMILIHSVNTIMSKTKLSLKQRGRQIENLVKKHYALFENFEEELA